MGFLTGNNKDKCSNRYCIDGYVYENVDGKQVRRKCPKCKGRG